MSLPPPRPKKVLALRDVPYEPAVEVRKGCFYLRGRLALVICSKCKNEQGVAFGSVALSFTREQAIEAGRALGWKMDPTVLCLFCHDEDLPNLNPNKKGKTYGQTG